MSVLVQVVSVAVVDSLVSPRMPATNYEVVAFAGPLEMVLQRPFVRVVAAAEWMLWPRDAWL
jgi:hypothetical protein